MNVRTCPICQNKFYTAVGGGEHMACPFCGLQLKTDKFIQREEKRNKIRKECSIVRGGTAVSAQTVDISDKGVGVMMMNSTISFAPDETVKVTINDLQVDAKVAWFVRLDDLITRAGLKFHQA